MGQYTNNLTENFEMHLDLTKHFFKGILENWDCYYYYTTSIRHLDSKTI